MLNYILECANIKGTILNKLKQAAIYSNEYYWKYIELDDDVRQYIEQCVEQTAEILCKHKDGTYWTKQFRDYAEDCQARKHYEFESAIHIASNFWGGARYSGETCLLTKDSRPIQAQTILRSLFYRIDKADIDDASELRYAARMAEYRDVLLNQLMGRDDQKGSYDLYHKIMSKETVSKGV